jgi:Domain of unknown function (DUF4411)
VIYLLDSNVLITAHNTYYPINRVPEFWDWLLHHATDGHLKVPLELVEEIKDGTGDPEKDRLYGWLNEPAVRDALVLNEGVQAVLLQDVIERGYAPDLNDIEIESVGRDPFLIAYALVAAAERCVVSNETAAPRRLRANRKIPDVCAALGAQCCNTFALVKALDFTTGWRG